MLIECCSQERSYLKFYGLLGERFAKLNPIWSDAFLSSFATVLQGTFIDWNESNQKCSQILRSHVLNWRPTWSPVLSLTIELTEEGTTSASRIFWNSCSRNWRNSSVVRSCCWDSTLPTAVPISWEYFRRKARKSCGSRLISLRRLDWGRWLKRCVNDWRRLTKPAWQEEEEWRSWRSWDKAWDRWR